MTTTLETLNPMGAADLTWDLNGAQELVPEEIQALSRDFNSTDYRVLVNPLRKQKRRDEETGIGYALLRDRHDSPSSVVAHIHPNANGLTDNMLVRAEYLRRAFRNLNITDEAGRNIPFLTLAVPSWRSSLDIDRHYRQRVAEGYFVHASHEYLKLTRHLGYGRVAVIGASLGAAIALPFASNAEFNHLDALSVGVAEPPNVELRPVLEFIGDFLKDMKSLKRYYKTAGVDASVKAHKRESGLVINSGLIRRDKTNLALVKGMAQASFGHDLEIVTRQGIPTTVGHGKDSLVTPTQPTAKAVADARTSTGYREPLVHAIAVENAGHLWDNNLPFLATFYGYALLRSRTPKA